MSSTFSVLLSLYAKEKPEFLEQALCSVFEQTLPPAEVVLVLDGAITPQLQEVVAAFKTQYPQTLKIVPLKENIGLGPALNEGLKYCTHELVARMDTDDICKPERFEKQVNAFHQHPEVDAMSSWVEEFCATPDEIISIRKLPQTHSELKAWAKRRSPFNHPAVMYKKSRVAACGGYELLGQFDDYVLWMKMLQRGAVFYNIQESLLHFRFNKEAHRRRHGFKYAMTECRLQWMFYRRGMIGLPTAITNIAIRLGVRIMPVWVVGVIYRKLLR